MNPLSQPDTKKAVNFPKGSWEKSELSSRDNNFETSNKQLIFNQSKMIPNNFVVTTAVQYIQYILSDIYFHIFFLFL